MIGIAILVAFAIAAALMYARVLPALLAVPLMALAIGALSGVGLAGLETIVIAGTVKLAPVVVTVIFGALLSRVTMSTGIAETIVGYAAEYGGDEPLVVAFALCAAVAVLFTTLAGLGAIIMVGSIVLPIMLGVGLNRRAAATLFMLAFALGFIFNITQWTFYATTFGIDPHRLQPFAVALAIIDGLVLVAYALIAVRRSRGYATWAIAAAAPPERRRVSAIAVLTPVVPLGLYYAAHLNPVVAFALAALFGVITTRPRESIPQLVAAAIRGVEDVAPAILLFFGIGMLLEATTLPQVRAALEPLVTMLAPRSWPAYVILFGLLSPLALYRGPLNPFGVGIAIYTVLAGLGILPPLALVVAIMAVVQVQNACDPTNTQNVWVANFTGVGVQEITRATLPYQTLVATLATLCAVFLGPQLFGQRFFALAEPAVAATPAPASTPGWPGLLAPPSANGAVAVRDDGSILARAAAAAARRQIAKNWAGYRVGAANGEPAASDCARKDYAAVITFTSDRTQAHVGTIVDYGARLADCAGWPVDQWYDTRTYAEPPSLDDAGFQGLDLLLRMRDWMRSEPARSRPLFARGLAYDVGSKEPAYYYSLFKTVDGQMRAFVRPGGPAWVAGLRTNDIVVKLDGKFWWEYGTYQTELRAHDGLPHTFVVSTVIDGPQHTIQLGDPYRGK
ncbi:MAG: hypothetical protein ACREM6_15745 [Vulcanimicrobiaceae bacterium]